MKKTRHYHSPMSPDEIKAVGAKYIRTKQGSLFRVETAGFDPEKHVGKMRGTLLENGFRFKIAPPSSSGMYIDATITTKARGDGSAVTCQVGLDWLWKLGWSLGLLMMGVLIGVALMTDDFRWIQSGGKAFGESDLLVSVSPLYIAIFGIVTAIALPYYKKRMHLFVETKLLGTEVQGEMYKSEPWKV